MKPTLNVGFFILCIFILPLSVEAQPGSPTFGPQTLIDVADDPKSVIAGDIDGDGLEDVIAALAGENQVVWYKNLGGLQFSSRNIISSEDYWPVEVLCEDVDFDGDNDVVSASMSPLRIRVSVNDGFGNFDTTFVVFDSQPGEVYDIEYSDVDGDQIGDILVAVQYIGYSFWIKNYGNLHFEFGKYIGEDQYYIPKTIRLAELNGDTLIDLLMVQDYHWINGNQFVNVPFPRVVYFPNKGMGLFEEFIVINPDQEIPNDASAADFNGDGDIDVAIGDYGGTICWHENDGNGNFGEKQVLAEGYTNTYRLFAADADSDGDNDLIFTTLWDGEIVYFQNQSFGIFSEPEIVTTNAIRSRGLHMADLDNDGDKEILSASWEDGKIAYYENHHFTVFIEKNNLEADILKAYPNPFTTTLVFSFSLKRQAIISISIYDNHGVLIHKTKEIAYRKGTHEIELDLCCLSEGLYFYHFRSGRSLSKGKLIHIK